MDTDTVLAASAFAISMSGTPGPNNAMLAASGATFGFRRTLPHMLGITAGFPAMLVVVALGGGGLLRAAPVLHEALKWTGAAYLLWLAFKIGTARPGATAPGARTLPLTALQAALFQWVNPKAWIIVVSAIATYTGNAATILGPSLALAAIFVAATLPSTALWTMTGVGAARLLRSERGLRGFNLAMAALLVASLLPLLRSD